MPPVGIPGIQAGAADVFSRGSRGGDRPARWHPVDDIAGVEIDRASTARDMIERWAIRVLSKAQRCANSVSPEATRASSAGCSRRSTSAQPSAAMRFDIEAM